VKLRPGPILALTLLVGLGIYTYVAEFRGKEAAEKAASAKDRPIAIDRASLKAIRITNGNGDLRLEREGEGWKLTAPIPTPADKDAVEGLINAIEMAHVERRIKDAGERKDYGLDPPRATLAIETSAGGQPETLAVGDRNSIGGTHYALLPGTNDVAVVSGSLGDVADKTLLALRDRSLLALDAWKMKRFTIERGRETIRMEKPEEGWIIREPIEAPADGPTITDLLTALQNLHATSIPSEKPTDADLRRFGLQPPQARLVLFQEGWDVDKAVVFGKEDPGGGRWARTLGRDPVFVVPADFWPKVTTRLFDLRRKDLLGVQQYRIESATFARAGKPASTLARQKDQTWSLTGGTRGSVKSETADTFLRTIGDLKALSFDDQPPEAIRAALSRRPALDLTLQEEVDTAGGTAKSQHLLLGPPDKKGNVLVRDMAWRPIATVASAVLDRINTQIDAVIKEAAEPPAPQPSPAATPAPSPAP
jgi:uncharacterized protein DUF4340